MNKDKLTCKTLKRIVEAKNYGNLIDSFLQYDRNLLNLVRMQLKIIGVR